MPPPVDPRETAEGVGPQAVPASRQAAPHAFEGQEGEGPRIPMRVPITDRPKKVDSRHLQAIVREINDTPMKVLDWETPNEVWYRELGKVMSKTSHPKTSVALTN